MRDAVLTQERPQDGSTELVREPGVGVAVKKVKVDATPRKKRVIKKNPEVIDSAATRVPVETAAAEPKKISLDPSPYLLTFQKREEPSAPPPPPAPIVAEKPPKPETFGFFGDPSHRRDMASRSLSVRPRGFWAEFPPKHANNFAEAAAIIFVSFFERHFPKYFPTEAAPVKDPVQETAPTAAVIKTAATLAERRAELAAWPIKKRAIPLSLPEGWQRSLAGFAVIAAALVLPVAIIGIYQNLIAEKQSIENSAKDAIASLRTAGEAVSANDFGDAGRAFGDAARQFNEADAQLGLAGDLLRAIGSVLPADKPFSAAPLVLSAGKEISAAGVEMTAGLAALDAAKNPVDKVSSLESHFAIALPHLQTASQQLTRISPEAVPGEYRAEFATATQELPKLTGTITEALSLASLVKNIAGAAGARRYLVVFQNNAEMRPTGGFIGSFALVDVNKGVISKMNIPGGGSYDLKGSLKLKLASPQPLHLINPVWQFQDANWSPDFPTSARELTRFYEKSGGPTTDGVIAINMSLMERLLEAVGPIEMPEYGKTITSKNFYYETQKAVELDYDKTANTPKKFISDLTPKVLTRLLSADRATMIKVANVMQTGLATKEMQLWFRDADLEKSIADRGWAGALAATDGDSLAIVHANIAGQKTDLVINEKIKHRVKILADGSALATLTIARTHNGVKNAVFSGVRNVDYLRVYVPLGSELVEAVGFTPPDPTLFKMTPSGYSADELIAAQENGSTVDRASSTTISSENGRTVFGNWVQTDPGTTSTVSITYKLPANAVKMTTETQKTLFSIGQPKETRTISYSLLMQKQSGVNPVEFTSSVDLPRGFVPAWQSPARTAADDGTLSVTQTLDRDSYFGLVATK